jgi:DNA-directed RNA polymerase subunit RPC12/RpoP
MLVTHHFQCAGCGASMSYDARVQRLRCPFCGGERLEAQGDTKALAPKLVVRFEKDQNDALPLLRKWMGNSFWRPGDLAAESIITRLTPVYVPYWVFSGRTFTHWTADSSQTPGGARADWYPVSGDHQGEYAGILIGASGALTPAETHALGQYDLATGVPPEDVDLENAAYEPFSVQRKYARALMQEGFEQLEAEACQALVPGNARNVHVNVRVEGLTSVPVLLPVWVMAYQYRGELYRFVVNGQTGRSTGTAPTSMLKVASVAAMVIGGLLLLFVAAVICSGIAAR